MSPQGLTEPTPAAGPTDVSASADYGPINSASGVEAPLDKIVDGSSAAGVEPGNDDVFVSLASGSADYPGTATQPDVVQGIVPDKDILAVNDGSLDYGVGPAPNGATTVAPSPGVDIPAIAEPASLETASFEPVASPTDPGAEMPAPQ